MCTGYNVRSSASPKPTTNVTTDITKPTNDSNTAKLEACLQFLGNGGLLPIHRHLHYYSLI